MASESGQAVYCWYTVTLVMGSWAFALAALLAQYAGQTDSGGPLAPVAIVPPKVLDDTRA